jgi:hypothetical protein
MYQRPSLWIGNAETSLTSRNHPKLRRRRRPNRSLHYHLRYPKPRKRPKRRKNRLPAMKKTRDIL